MTILGSLVRIVTYSGFSTPVSVKTIGKYPATPQKAPSERHGDRLQGFGATKVPEAPSDASEGLTTRFGVTRLTQQTQSAQPTSALPDNPQQVSQHSVRPPERGSRRGYSQTGQPDLATSAPRRVARSLYPVPRSLYPVHRSTKPVPRSTKQVSFRRQAAGGRQQAAGNGRQAAGSRQQAAGSRQQAAGSRQQAAGNGRRALG